jgi:hypothetical protein
MKLLRTLSIALSLATIPALASAAPSDAKDNRSQMTAGQIASKRITKLDQNNDGMLEAREVKGTRLGAQFAVLDVDKDGKVSKSELADGIKAHRAERQARTADAGTRGKHGRWNRGKDGKAQGKGVHRHGKGMRHGKGNPKGKIVAKDQVKSR